MKNCQYWMKIRICNNHGFTLIEMLVVTIIISILSAIAMPILSSQVNKAKRVEAVINLSAYQKNQQAFQLENSRLATSLGYLSLPTETENYIYTIDVTPPSKPEDEGRTVACATARPKKIDLDLMFACVSD
jgi:prepilin-type N-terminal cleavage/methylation domain-containing protein